MIRVGFLINFSDRLLGNLNYFRNLIEAIGRLENRKIEPVILTGYSSDLDLTKDFPTVEIVKTKILDRKSPAWILHKVSQFVLPNDIIMERLLRKYDISVLSHSGSVGRHSKIKCIGWIPDFQHKYLSELFSKAEINYRDLMHRKLFKECTSVIVSSCDSLADVKKFYPEYVDKTKVLQFVAGPLEKIRLLSREELEYKYKFSGPYFHVPNQFWVHKNHKTVIDALGVLKEKGIKTLVILTGKTYDHRQPQYFNDIMAHIEDQNLKDSLRILGVVPYCDLVSIMRNSIAIINPSSFEGWSSTVEEAKSLGKRVILSDIPVHREQNPQGGYFFGVNDAEMLADILQNILEDLPSFKDEHMSHVSKRELIDRKLFFAKQYQDIVIDVCNKVPV